MKSLFIAVVLCVAAVNAWDKPDFCKQDDCPEYTVVSTSEDYEIREYAAMRLAMVKYRATNIFTKFSSMNSAFMKLFQYIQGFNVDEQDIAMTRPVVTVVRNCDEADCSQETHEMGFYLTYASAAEAPIPLSAEVEIVEMPAAKYYVKSFGGYSFEMGFDRQLRNLKKAIGDESAYDNTYHVNAGYNSPMELMNRHNEVMLKVVEE